MAKGGTRGQARRAKKTDTKSTPTHRSTPSTPGGEAPPSGTGPRLDSLLPKLLVAGLVLLVIALLVPWKHTPNGLAWAWGLMAYPEHLAGATRAWGPGMVIPLVLVPVGVVLGALLLYRRADAPHLLHLAVAALAAVALTVFSGYHTDLTGAFGAGYHSMFAGMADVVVAMGALGFVLAWAQRPDDRVPRALALLAGGGVLAYLVVPTHTWDFTGLPLMGMLRDALESGGVHAASLAAGAVTALAALAIIVAALRSKPTWALVAVIVIVATRSLWHLGQGLTNGDGLLYGPFGFVTGWMLLGGLAIARVTVAVREDDALPKPLSMAAKGADWALPVLVGLLYLLLKTHGMRASTTDENIYFYGAVQLSKGVLPYRDFFFAHPPLHLAIPALVFKVFGFSLPLAKAIAPLASLASGVAVYLTGRRVMGRLPGVVAMVLFLFSYELLMASTNMTGINLTTMFLAWGLYLFLRRRFVLAGVILALGAQTGFYMIAAALTMIALTFLGPLLTAPSYSLGSLLKASKDGLKILGAFVVVYFAIFLVCYAIGGDDYILGTFTYHGLKKAKDARLVPYFGGPGFITALFHNLKVFWTTQKVLQQLYYHAHLIMGTAAAAVAIVWVTTRRLLAKAGPRTESFGLAEDERAAWKLLVIVAALVVQFSMFKELYDFYFILFFPAMALLVAYAVKVMVANAWSAVVDARPGRLALSVLVALLLALWVPVSGGANEHFDGEVDHAGETRSYTWVDPPHLASLGDFVKATFWKDHRTKNGMEPGYRHYLWNKKLYFSTIDEIAELVATTTTEGQTITGSSLVAPLVALYSGRDMAAHEVDTNAKRFKTGILTREAFWTMVCATDLKYVVSSYRSFFSPKSLSKQPFMKKYFKVAKVFHETENRHSGNEVFVLYERKSDPPGGVPPVCAYPPQ